jgi:hypothetical protein
MNENLYQQLKRQPRQRVPRNWSLILSRWVFITLCFAASLAIFIARGKSDKGALVILIAMLSWSILMTYGSFVHWRRTRDSNSSAIQP